MMVRGSILVFVVVYSILILRKTYSRHHWLGVLLIIVGVVFVGWGGIRATSDSEFKISVPALLIIFGAQVLNAMTLISEEIIFKKYSVSPMYLLGLEGVFSMGIQVGILAVL